MYCQHYFPYVIAFNPHNKGTDLVFSLLILLKEENLVSHVIMVMVTLLLQIFQLMSINL